MPIFLLLLPYGNDTIPVKAFDYNEDISKNHDRYLWGNTAFVLAARINDSFVKYRMCTNIIVPKGGGAVHDLPFHLCEDMGAIQLKIPTEVLLSERREFELAEEGFIGFAMRKGSDNASFFSANFTQKPKYFGETEEAKDSETNYKFGIQLPYIFVINRLTHYIKVIQRENIGTWKNRTALQAELSNWISQYVINMENPIPGTRRR